MDQNPRPTPMPADYLDSIAVQPQQKTMSPKLLWVLIGGGLLFAIIVFFGLLGLVGGGTSPTERFLSYEYRVIQLAKITDDEVKTIKSSDLRALNGSLHTILVGAQSQAEQLQPKLGIKSYKAPAKDAPIIDEFTTLTTKLDDGRLNNTFDQVYSREMAYQLANIVAELASIKKASRSSEVKAYADDTTANLKTYIDQLSQFNAQT